MHNSDELRKTEIAFSLGIKRYRNFNLNQLGEILTVNPVPANNTTVKITTVQRTNNGSIEADIARFTIADDGTLNTQDIELLNGTSKGKMISHVDCIGRLPDSAPDEIIVYVIAEPFDGNMQTVEKFCSIWNLSLPDPLLSN